jgi:hypothetical protein
MPCEQPDFDVVPATITVTAQSWAGAVVSEGVLDEVDKSQIVLPSPSE